MCGFSGLPKFRQLVAPIGSRAGASHVARGFRDSVHRAQPRIEIAPASVAVERHGQPALRALDADHAGIARARAFHRVGLHHVIVLLPDPALAADVGTGEQSLQIGGEVAASASLMCSGISRGDRRLPALQRTLVDRRIVGERLVGNLGDDFAVVQHAHLAVGGDAADFDRVQSPLLEDAKNFLLAAFLRHQQHALLRFAEHDLVRRHAGFALRHEVEFDLDARRGRGRPSRRWSRSARRRPCPECRRSRRSAWLRGRLRAAASPETDRPPARWAAWLRTLR